MNASLLGLKQIFKLFNVFLKRVVWLLGFVLVALLSRVRVKFVDWASKVFTSGLFFEKALAIIFKIKF